MHVEIYFLVIFVILPAANTYLKSYNQPQDGFGTPKNEAEVKQPTWPFLYVGQVQVGDSQVMWAHSYLHRPIPFLSWHAHPYQLIPRCSWDAGSDPRITRILL